MGKGRPRAVEKGVLGPSLGVSSVAPLNIPSGPVYYPTEDEFRDPLEYIYKIRPEAEPYGICRIVPPSSWKPPFALDLDSFTFPTKTQAIHQLQARPASCDSKTFELEYNRFLDDHFGKRAKKRVVFEGEELDLCKFFNAVKRYGGYEKVVDEKKWGEVYRVVGTVMRISECAKHVLCQLYREHLFDYENYYNQLNKVAASNGKRGRQEEIRSGGVIDFSLSKRRRRNKDADKVKVQKVDEKEEYDQICEQCKSGLHGEVMLLCDRCNKGWHLYCLSPPLKQVPPGNWYCLDCLNSDKDSFGFIPGKIFSLEAFRRVAERAKKKWFGLGSASKVQIEKKFWEIVEGSLGEVEVMYGSDLDTSVYGSGFPRENDKRPESVDAKVWDKFCASPWNLNNLPKLKGSVLRAVHQNITGVTVPWLYIGMLFSSFCWHFEDHCFYSINYMHWGEPKCWYSVPGSEAAAFEKVMRKCLPDLFDAQPDLLFQLVTMLNPSVLQENKVPVYSIQQEPGNFVITFPRSFHGGFNFGLNCAEAVNFAPADWIPHGEFGAELYQLYRKTPILSHEELLCVVAKNDCNIRVAPYLKKELVRIYFKEKRWREQLWKNGIVRSSSMSPRKCPDYVTSEEDPVCIICQQYLYLSAVVCRCRKSVFVCLEHCKHLCECKNSKRRLLYRYTLAELYDLVLTADKYVSDETLLSLDIQKRNSCHNTSSSLTRKVKDGLVTFAQLAESWLLHSTSVLQNPFSLDAYAKVLKEAEQFMWAGSEIDHVRDRTKKLMKAQKWTEGVRDCVSRVEKWLKHESSDVQKINLDYVNDFLSLDPLLCNEPGYLKLKDYAKEANFMVQEVDTILTTCSNVSEWESLYSRISNLPVYVKESEKLWEKISSAKACIESIRDITENQHSGVDVEDLYKLKSKVSDIGVHFPETERLLDLIRQVELCRFRCSETLKGPINLEIVELLLEEFGSFSVDIPELKVLRKYHGDAVSLVARFNDIIKNCHEREDQNNVVHELNFILRDALSLKIQVDEIPLVEAELKKACCREKAQKAHSTKMTLDFIVQLMMEAAVHKIDGEKLFVGIRGVLDAAMSWEDRAKYFLANGALMSDFEDIIRTSEDIYVILPSLDGVMNEVLEARSWLMLSKPFLESCSSTVNSSSSLLEVEKLKELISHSKLLNISLEEKKLLKLILRNCEEWMYDASSVLQDAVCLLDTENIEDGLNDGLISAINHLICKIDSVMKAGSSLWFDFCEISELQNACSALNWCNKALSLCSIAFSYEDVKNLIRTAEMVSGTYVSSNLWKSLMDGIKWLKRGMEVTSQPCDFESSTLSDAEEVLADSLTNKVKFSRVIQHLESSINNHKVWQGKVHYLLSMKSRERSWSQILQLKDLGSTVAFKCSELDALLTEVEKVEKWKQQCIEIVGGFVRDEFSLFGALKEIKQTLDRSLYDNSFVCKERKCELCSNALENQELLTCPICKEGYHFQIAGPLEVNRNHGAVFMCARCRCLMDTASHHIKSTLRGGRNRPELEKLIQHKFKSEDFCNGIEEVNMLNLLVEQALICRSRIKAVLDFASCHISKDLSVVFERLTIASKGLEMARIVDHEAISGLELAFLRNSWRVRVKRILEDLQRPALQQIETLLKKGLDHDIPPADYYREKLTEAKNVCVHWVNCAKKVSADMGTLELDKVFELITEGENLPVQVEKELKLLRTRSMLYCICRKPYDQRAMIACDHCDEWYHFDCIKLHSTPKIFICPACKPLADEKLCKLPLSVDHESSMSRKCGEPKTPSPRNSKPRAKPKKAVSGNTVGITDCADMLRYTSGIERLWWQNRKPFRRASKKRAELQSLSPFIHLQD